LPLLALSLAGIVKKKAPQRLPRPPPPSSANKNGETSRRIIETAKTASRGESNVQSASGRQAPPARPTHHSTGS